MDVLKRLSPSLVPSALEASHDDCVACGPTVGAICRKCARSSAPRCSPAQDPKDANDAGSVTSRLCTAR
jgi:hypothetical protein